MLRCNIKQRTLCLQKLVWLVLGRYSMNAEYVYAELQTQILNISTSRNLYAIKLSTISSKKTNLHLRCNLAKPWLEQIVLFIYFSDDNVHGPYSGVAWDFVAWMNDILKGTINLPIKMHACIFWVVSAYKNSAYLIKCYTVFIGLYLTNWNKCLQITRRQNNLHISMA